MDYRTDIIKALKRETDLIKKQTMLEVISIVTSCDTYDDFKKAMYGMALEYFREMEDEGLVVKGTVDKVISGNKEVTKEDITSTSEMPDDIFML